jgi:hypothetical protein
MNELRAHIPSIVKRLRFRTKIHCVAQLLSKVTFHVKNLLTVLQMLKGTVTTLDDVKKLVLSRVKSESCRFFKA